MSASAQGRGQAAGAESTPVMKRGSHLVSLLPAAPSLCPPGDLELPTRSCRPGLEKAQSQGEASNPQVPGPRALE